jgi:hypothetical protein
VRKPTDLGTNRTGLAASPIDGKRLVAAAENSRPSVGGSESGIIAERIAFARESEPVGSVPPPTSLKGIAVAAKLIAHGAKPSVFLDKLGERLAFERTAIRLYDALLSKFDAFGSWEDGPARADLLRFHGEELEHYDLLREAIHGLGADPTALTPSADLAVVALSGVMQVVTDSRTSLRESLEAVRIAELVDSTSWEDLTGLAHASGYDRLAGRFERVQMEEASHVVCVRRWIAAGLKVESALPVEAPPALPPTHV